MNDESLLNLMIGQSQICLKEPTYEHWFTRGHQKILMFNLAAKLFVEFGKTPEEAIDMADDFINTFYKLKVNSNTRR